jgi:hypothetical protein
LAVHLGRDTVARGPVRECRALASRHHARNQEACLILHRRDLLFAIHHGAFPVLKGMPQEHMAALGQN